MTHPNASTALASAVVDELIRGGVRSFVVAPGSRSAALAIAAARREELSVFVQVDERSAAFFALGVARRTGHPAVVLTTSGSAVTHLFPAIVEADTGLVPLVALTADRPPELHGVGANQTIEQRGIFGSHVRWSAELGPGEHRSDANAWWRSVVCRAVDEAVDGPVHLNVAFREPVVPETDDGRDVDIPFTFDTAGRGDGSRWSPGERPEVASVALPPPWTSTERGVVVAGEAPFTSVEAVDQLAAALGWPLIAEPALGGRPPQSISTAHHILSDERIAERLRPDVALVVGRANLSRPVARWLADVPTVIIDPRISNPGRRAARVLRAWPVVEPVGARSNDWRRLWLHAEEAARKALEAALDAQGLTEPRLARDVARAVPAGGTLAVASSMPIRDLDMVMAPGALEVISNRGASGIDGFVSTTLGAASAGRGPMVALAGDLAMLHDANGFLVTPRPDAVFVVVNNDGGGIFSFLPQVRQHDVFEQIFGTPHGRSFAALAALHDLHHEPLTDPSDQIARAISERGIWILEARTDRLSNPAMHRELTAQVVAAARVSLEG